MLKNIWIVAVFGLLLATLPMTASGQGIVSSASTSVARADVPVGAVRQSGTDDPNYRIGAQDLIDVSVWKEAELSRQVPVRPDGKISLPLLNDVQAAGLNPTELAAQITAGLNKFITSPQVTVIVLQINSQRIYILGEVARVGAYDLLPGMTILQALSNAGGFTPFANLKSIYVLRQENGKPIKHFFNYKEVIGGKKTEQNIGLLAGDTVIVP